MKKRMLPRLAPTLLLLAAVLAGCNKDETDDNQLPDGKQPVTLIAGMDELTTTRATTDNTWIGGEEVAVQMDGEVKKYTADTNGKLTVANGVTPWYWASTGDTKTVSAWYPYNNNGTKPATFTVATDQSSTGYQASDMIYAPAKTISYGSSTLMFYHLPAKVVVNLKAGDSVTEEEMQGATVTLVNQNLTSGAISTTGWSVAQATSGSSNITPNALTTPATGCHKSVQALVVPQQMQSKKFIKVTTSGAASCDYYYTPTGVNDAKFESGKQYTYTITVKKTGLEVNAGTSVSWTDSNQGSNTATTATFRVTIPTVSDISMTFTGVTQTSGNAYYEVQNNTNTFSLTYTAPVGMKGFPVVQGLCKVKRTLESDGKYKFTYTDIRSDLKLAYDVYAEEGDFYCRGTNEIGYLVPGDVLSLTEAQKTDCLGVVFKAGRDDAGDWKDDCTYFLKDETTSMSTFHGYVFALHDANSGNTCAWGPTNTTVGTNTEQNTGFYGYKNTKAIKLYAITNSKNLQNDFPATYYATEGYETSYPAPANSSGWFLPSAGQCKYWLNNKDALLASVRKATNDSYNWKEGYWSSSESSESSILFACFVSFTNSNMGYIVKNGDYSVRSIFAF